MKCLGCFKNRDFFPRLEKLAALKSLQQKQALRAAEKLFSENRDFYPGLSLCNFYSKKLTLPRRRKQLAAYKKYLREESSSFHLVFIDGVWQKKLSSFAPFLQMEKLPCKLWNQALKDKSLGLLNLALGEKPCFFTVKKEGKIKKPLQIVNFITEKKDVFAAPLVFFRVGENASLQIVEETVDLQKSPLPVFAPYFFFQLEKMSNVKFVRLNLDSFCRQHFFVRAFLEEKANFALAGFTSGGQAELFDFKAVLQKRASSSVNMLSFLKEKKTGCFQSVMQHQGPQSFSDQLYKSILTGQSNFSVLGEVAMDPKTEKSNASFLNRNLLLSSRAKVFSQPFLKISSDEVKAKHGCTSARLSEEELFFLKSRGIREKAAKKCLLQSFCREIKNLIMIKSISKSIDRHFYADFKA